jgi:hypothetical protein
MEHLLSGAISMFRKKIQTSFHSSPESYVVNSTREFSNVRTLAVVAR